jgi:hypothetical protein
MKKIIFAIFLSIGLLSIACKKHTVNTENSGANQSKFEDIKAPQNFKWSTLNTINFKYIPVANDARVSTLKIVDAAGNIYFQRLQKANQPFETNIEVPGHIQQLEMRFAGIKKPIALANGKATITLR